MVIGKLLLLIRIYILINLSHKLSNKQSNNMPATDQTSDYLVWWIFLCNSLTDFPVWQIIFAFGVCQIILLARLLSAGHPKTVRKNTKTYISSTKLVFVQDPQDRIGKMVFQNFCQDINCHIVTVNETKIFYPK